MNASPACVKKRGVGWSLGQRQVRGLRSGSAESENIPENKCFVEGKQKSVRRVGAGRTSLRGSQRSNPSIQTTEERKISLFSGISLHSGAPDGVAGLGQVFPPPPSAPAASFATLRVVAT